ncbi:hypothetical protein V1278_003787 [Bradyrhizobium sp. AZCC 1577]
MTPLETAKCRRIIGHLGGGHEAHFHCAHIVVLDWHRVGRTNLVKSYYSFGWGHYPH